MMAEAVLCLTTVCWHWVLMVAVTCDHLTPVGGKFGNMGAKRSPKADMGSRFSSTWMLVLRTSLVVRCVRHGDVLGEIPGLIHELTPDACIRGSSNDQSSIQVPPYLVDQKQLFNASAMTRWHRACPNTVG